MRDRQTIPGSRWLVCLAVVVALWPAPSFAEADEDVFTIYGVAVDVTAGDTRQARENAIRTALARAWRQLGARLVLGDPSAVVNQDAGTLEALAQGLEVDDEKISTGRYQAVFTVRFHARAALEIFQRSGVEHLETPSPVLLVLPVLQTGRTTVLWEDANAWLAAWQFEPDRGNVVEIVVPRSDVQDIVLLDASGALSRDWSVLEALVSLYRADAVLVAHATAQSGYIRQRLTWLDGESARPVLMARNAPDTRPDGAFREAVIDARLSVDEHWAEITLAPEGPMTTVLVDIPVESLADWIDIRSRMESSPVLREIIPLVMSTTRVRVRLRHSGTRDDLFFRMRRMGLDVDDRAGVLVISRL